jgi:hypothetical protein
MVSEVFNFGSQARDTLNKDAFNALLNGHFPGTTFAQVFFLDLSPAQAPF